MSSFYRRHSRIFQFASVIYLLPCSYNEQVDQFQETVRNRLSFAVNILMTVPFWFVDVKLMSVVYLNHLSNIMVILGSIEIAVYVSIAACTLLNSFFYRRRIVRMMNVLFRSDWLLDRYTKKEERYDNGRKFAVTVLIMLTMTCSNLAYHEDFGTRLLSLTVAIKIFAVCYLCFLHRICVGAIGIRMEQLNELYREAQEGLAGREQMLSYFVDRFELYAAQLYETTLGVHKFEDYRYRNTKVAKQLQRFMLHSLERDTQFTVNNFFNIDYSMIQMIFSAIITHTLILIQFDQMQPEVMSYGTKLNNTG
uniref:Gustatory receptor n=1 Tax=Anopheles atroparvus TaxID=41427 RepID=A0AAG5DC46_ANOAO